jgi:hypothetical protein
MKNSSSESMHEVEGSFSLWGQPLGEPLGVCTVIVEDSFAFWRQPLGKPLDVYTVIVDHIILSHPLEFSLFVRVQNFLYSEVRRISNNTEVVEGCNKGRFSPVGLDKPNHLRSDYPHCLVIRIMIAL